VSPNYDRNPSDSPVAPSEIKSATENVATVEAAAEALREVEIEAAQSPSGFTHESAADCLGSCQSGEAFSPRRPR
jgi:hypothetical protein